MTHFRNYKKYKNQVLFLFELFINNTFTRDKLISELRLIENALKNNKDTKKSIWFKFYKHYNLATTINDFEFQDSFFTDAMKIAINNPLEFKIHFS